MADLVVHERTPFAEIAASGERVLFVDGGEFVEGSRAQNPARGRVGVAERRYEQSASRRGRVRATAATG